jgi:F0F1-type ATP synthase epsilon subunit
MPRYILVYTKPSKKKEVGEVITYDKDGAIGIFHRKAPLTKKLKPGMLVIAKLLSRKSRNKRFNIIYPLYIVEGHKIPEEYDRTLEVWGAEPYRELKRRKMRRRLRETEAKLENLDKEIDLSRR